MKSRLRDVLTDTHDYLSRAYVAGFPDCDTGTANAKRRDLLMNIAAAIGSAASNDEPSIDDCIAHRCIEHLSVPPLNHSEMNGAECGACVGREENRRTAAVERELADERLIKLDLLEALKAICEFWAYGMSQPDGDAPTAEDEARVEELAAKAAAAIAKAESPERMRRDKGERS